MSLPYRGPRTAPLRPPWRTGLPFLTAQGVLAALVIVRAWVARGGVPLGLLGFLAAALPALGLYPLWVVRRSCTVEADVVRRLGPAVVEAGFSRGGRFRVLFRGGILLEAEGDLLMFRGPGRGTGRGWAEGLRALPLRPRGRRAAAAAPDGAGEGLAPSLEALRRSLGAPRVLLRWGGERGAAPPAAEITLLLPRWRHRPEAIAEQIDRIAGLLAAPGVSRAPPRPGEPPELLP